MARQDALQGSLPLLVLTLLARRGALHGYGIATAIEGMSDETLRCQEGSLYPALHRLEHQGLIEAEWAVSELGRRAKYYRLTAAGRKRLSHEASEWERMATAIGRVMKLA